LTLTNNVRRLAPFYPTATLAVALLAGNISAAFATDTSLPEAQESTTPMDVATAAEAPANPVNELPPAPSETSELPPASLVREVKAGTLPILPDATVYKVGTPGNSDVDGGAPKTKAWKGEPLRGLVKRLNVALPLPQGRIEVDKSQRRLDLYNGEILLKSYTIALGSNPVGHKQQQGDGRTPEGQLYICTRNNKTSSFHIFLGLSYPTLPDAKKAVEKKAITPREFQIIRQRLASRGAPLWETRLGGWIGIHGGTDAGYAQRTMKSRKSKDWTAGCLGLTNREIDELYAATKIGTPVFIKP